MRWLGLVPSQPARCFEWSGPYREEFARDKSASAITGRATYENRERYLAKECVGSNRAVEKNDRNFPQRRQPR